MNLFDNYNCECLKCQFDIKKYTCNKVYWNSNKKSCKKVGGLLTVNNDYIILVQSCGKHWGPPKGTLEENESIKDCAIREIKEETGLDVSKIIPETYFKIKSKFYYYYMNINNFDCSNKIYINDDANGIGLFNIKCLYKNIISNKILINQHLKYILKYIFHINV